MNFSFRILIAIVLAFIADPGYVIGYSLTYLFRTVGTPNFDPAYAGYLASVGLVMMVFPGLILGVVVGAISLCFITDQKIEALVFAPESPRRYWPRFIMSALIVGFAIGVILQLLTPQSQLGSHEYL
jgi:hypothetical protein